METPLDDTYGHLVGLGTPSRFVEDLWNLCVPDTEELCLTGLCAVLGPEGGRGCSLDRQHASGEGVLPGGSNRQLHHRQHCGRL